MAFESAPLLSKTMNKDYKKALDLKLVHQDRKYEGIAHHPKSLRMVAFLRDHDFHDYQQYFDWADRSEGETLAFQMDAFFEMLDQTEKMNHCTCQWGKTRCDHCLS